ncbi:unnamed protein product [Linum tenue]|uniref:Transcription factor GAMYB n=1 Tax=Linum tenue TaxID=586396 RepID=A0AAV0QD78_9ROSI|nr:unnamed protein product [Linum tenue]
MTNGGEEKRKSKTRGESSGNEEGSSVGKCDAAIGLKKGPWTSAEDAILMEYVTTHGEGNWNAVQKHSGLSRCGKSCRLRWANHLRPDLKKGAFSPEEERLIIELHAKMGNKWARMAAELPGRTDNEIKNYWNTRIKRLQRAGLPIYPPEICLKVLEGNHQAQCMDTNGTNGGDPVQKDHREIPELVFKNFKINRGVLSYLPNLLDVPGSNIMKQDGFGSSNNYAFMLPTLPAPKRLRTATEDCIFPAVVDTGGVSSGLPPNFSQLTTDYAASERIPDPFGLSSPYDPSDVNITTYEGQPPFAALPGSHAFLNDDSSSSEPISGAMKLELPSLQYTDTHQLDSWGAMTPTASPLPSVESVDTNTFIQSPPPTTEQPESPGCLSPRSSGLLEAVLYESLTLTNMNCLGNNQASVAAYMEPHLPFDSRKRDWGIQADPNSPLGHSAASVFSVCTPMSGSSSDEPGCEMKQEMGSQVSSPYGEEKQAAAAAAAAADCMQIDFNRPDVLLGSGSYFGLSYGGCVEKGEPPATAQTDAAGGG